MESQATRHATLLNSDYGKSSKELIEFVGQLRALGARIDLELPRIVVIGNQSAGKSSLVEAISGISVPRDAGTCTRCPMECRLAHSSEGWSCQIKIRWEYDDNKRLDEDDVEPMLRRAQAAVLNPDDEPSKFLSLSEEEVKSGKGLKGPKSLLFSRNVVCVELKGPELADLSFVDLPGIVQNAEADVVQLVEDLVRSYIEGNSLILVTLPMSDDIENQKAARLAKLADSSGSRTIVLEGRRHMLRHGYYCTRQPDDDERTRGISGADARAAELAFFQSTAPWSSSSHQHRFGTANLVQNLSTLLRQIIRESLPRILDQVALQLESCNAQLEKLPPPITAEPTAFVLALVTSFCTELAQRVRGSPSNTALVQSTRRAYEAFKLNIRSSAPPFVPYKDQTQAPRDISEYLRVDANDRNARSKKFAGKVYYLEDVKAHISSSITRELPGNVPYAAKLALLQDFQNTWHASASGCFDEVQDAFKESVKSLVHEYFERYNALKTVVGPVTLELMKTCADTTVSHLKTILELETSPYTQNHHYFQESRDKWLAKYKDARAGKGPAERVTPAIVAPTPSFSFGGSVAGTAAKAPTNPDPKGDAHSAKLPVQPFSPGQRSAEQNHDAQTVNAPLAPVTNAFTFATPSPLRPPVIAPAPVDDTARQQLVTETLANLAKLGYTGIQEDDLGKLNPPDIYEAELEVMAEVRAYFQVAYKRVIDYIPLSIDHHFLYAFVKQLQQLLFERLGLGTARSAERCAEYIAEEPNMVASRDELLTKKKRLENVQRALFNFGL
ncbi:P-loop containing nucleoside triphosphate hydrolase protein [Cerioporus squamosus]|nr:P-loop containing nucleoside triphosphate hydrolase protein [Cerioporus squamosus]